MWFLTIVFFRSFSSLRAAVKENNRSGFPPKVIIVFAPE